MSGRYIVQRSVQGSLSLVSTRRSFQVAGFQFKIFRTFSFFTEVTRITRNWNAYLRRCSFLILTLINGEEKLPNYLAGTTEQVGMGTKNVISSVFFCRFLLFILYSGVN